MARRTLQDIFGGGSNATASRQDDRTSASRNRVTGRTDLQSYLAGFDTSTAGGKRTAVDRSLQAYLYEAGDLAQRSDANTASQLAFLQDEQALASQPTITDADINRSFGKAADTATVDAQGLMRSLREQMGMSGVRGGTAAGMGATVELQRLGQLTDAKRDLQMFRANADAQDRINRYQRAFGIGEVMGQEPSPFLSDALASLAGVRLTQQGLGVQADASIRAAQAAKDAGEQSMFGNILGGAMGLAGAFI